MKLKISHSQKGGSIELSDEILSALANLSEVDAHIIRDGIVIISAPGALESLADSQSQNSTYQMKGRQPDAIPSLDAPEQALIKKMIAIRFEERTVPALEKVLSEKEKSILSALISKKAVSIFKNAKYPKGVYNLADFIYPKSSAKHVASSPISHPAMPIPQPKAPEAYAPYAQASRSNYGISDLVQKGYMVLNDENEAKAIMPQISQNLKNDEVKGVRGFDRRYYVLRKSFLMQNEARLLSSLGAKPQSVQDLSKSLSLEEDATRVLLVILGEEGEVLEKRKGIWVRA